MAAKRPNTIIKYSADGDAGFYLFVRDQFNIYQKVEAFNQSHYGQSGQSGNFYVLDDKIPSGTVIEGNGNTYLIRSSLIQTVTINDSNYPKIIYNTASSAVIIVNSDDTAAFTTQANTAIIFDTDRIAFNIHEDADGSVNAVAVGSVAADGGNGDAITYRLKNPEAGFAIHSASGVITYTGTGFGAGDSAFTLMVEATDNAAELRP